MSLPTDRTRARVARTLALAQEDFRQGAYGRQYLYQALVLDMMSERAALHTIGDAASEICDDFESENGPSRASQLEQP